MKLNVSYKEKSQFLGIPESVLAFVLSLSVMTPMQAYAVSSTPEEKRIQDLEKRVRMLEKLLTQQAHANKVAARQAARPPRAKPAAKQVVAVTPPPPPPAAGPISPDKKIRLAGITITPGGFFAGEGVFRTRNLEADIGSPFQNIPLANSPLHYMKEFRLSARQSRLSALVEGQVNPDTLLSGYTEMDFLGNGSANSNESNSFDLRMRLFYANVDWNSWGFHLLAGQEWSLVTTNFKGITPRNEPLPPTIDAQYVVGYVWKRQAQLRLVKELGSAFTLAASVENPQTTFGGTACGTEVSALVGGQRYGLRNQVCTAPGAATLPSIVNFSLNHKPDLVGKLAYEQVLGNHRVHLEGFGIYRSLYNRVQWYPNVNGNHNKDAGGIGAGAVVEVIPKWLDFQGNLIGGRGIGSYASGQLPDATLAADGSLAPIPEVAFMIGATVHATRKLDLYVFGGQEKEKRKYSATGLNGRAGEIGPNYVGYGVPNANNTGCRYENGISPFNGASLPCQGNTRQLWQVTAGLWNKFYQGSYGELRGGLQYSYTERKVFSGNGFTSGQPNTTFPRNVSARANDQMVFASLRYYPFYTPPALAAAYK